MIYLCVYIYTCIYKLKYHDNPSMAMHDEIVVTPLSYHCVVFRTRTEKKQQKTRQNNKRRGPDTSPAIYMFSGNTLYYMLTSLCNCF